MSSQLRNESAEKEINCYDETMSVCQQSWWVVAVPGGLPFSVYLHISCFLASLSTLPPLEHTHMILWSIFKTAKHCWNRCNDPTVNLAYSVSPQRQATPSCVHLRGLLLRQGCQPKIFKNYVFDILWMESISKEDFTTLRSMLVIVNGNPLWREILPWLEATGRV